MIKKFIGVDSSLSGTGIVIVDENCNIIESKLIKTKTDKFSSYEERLHYIMTEVENFVSPYLEETEMVFIEGISYNSKGLASFQLATLNYFIRYFLFLKKVEFIDIAPKTVKKFITGDGQAQKNLMLLKVFKKYGIEFSDDNICDSWCMAKYGIDVINKRNKKTE